MRLLLDTHALLWFCEGSSELSSSAKDAMEDSSNQCFVSHASAWEIAIKLSLHKLHLDMGYEELFPTSVLTNGFHILDQTFAHYQELLALPFHHRDPFDRLLIAQARKENMTLVSCDRVFPAYDVPILW